MVIRTIITITNIPIKIRKENKQIKEQMICMIKLFICFISETVTKSNEEGFTGTPDKWFSDEEFFKNLASHCDFEGKKDYYFNSYSSFNIHEEMLKDRVRNYLY